MMQKLPIGISTLAKIRDNDFAYVDKTAYIYQLARESGYYFLSRPRRFGKSLLIDTLKHLCKKAWYNGYRWLGKSVYNPFDVLA